MTNAEIVALSERYLFPTYPRAPLAFVRGEGTRVWDADGRCYLDFFSSTVVANLGHRHPALVRAIAEQAERDRAFDLALETLQPAEAIRAA